MLLIFHRQSHIWQNSGSWVIYGPKCCQPIKLQDSLKCNISRKEWMIKFIFGVQINIEVFCKLILSFLVCATRHAKFTQNKKFAYLYNISRIPEELKLIFCLQIKAKVFYKLIVSLWVCIARHAQILKTTRLQYLCNISRKTWMMNLIFFLQINVKDFLKLLLSF